MEAALAQILQQQQESQERMAQQFTTALQAQATSQQQAADQFASVLQIQQQQMAGQAAQVAALQQQLEAMSLRLGPGSTSGATGQGQTPAAGSGLGAPVQHHLDQGDSEAVKSIVHPGILEKCATHDGQESTFPAWRFKFEGLAALIGLESYLESAITTDEADLKSTVLNDTDMALRAKAIWYLLVQSQSTKGTNVMLCLTQPCEKCNGFIAWKRICHEFQPQVGGRHNAMLTALLHPNWPKDGNFEELKAVWEKNIVEYEMQSKEKFTSGMRIATMCKYAPASVKSAVQMAAMSSMDDYAVFDSSFKAVRATTRQYIVDDGSPAPMQIGALGAGKGGKTKLPPQPCEFCGKTNHIGKDCFWNPRKKGGQGARKDRKAGAGKGGKGKQDGKGGKSAEKPKETRACRFCNKVGHLEKDCRLMKKAQGRVNALKALSQTQGLLTHSESILSASMQLVPWRSRHPLQRQHRQPAMQLFPWRARLPLPRQSRRPAWLCKSQPSIAIAALMSLTHMH